eukprot:scaffold8005_cov275-Amphora_coffeaeformis.AAC.29
MQPGSFQQAMQGTSIVFHTASPFLVNPGDNDDKKATTTAADQQKDLIDPAVKGTENVLHQATQTPTVERVVLTSSCAAIYGDAADTTEQGTTTTTTEASWNRTSTPQNGGAYSVSKTLAERKAWEMAGRQSQWKLVVLNPAFVLGPACGKSHPTSASFQTMQNIGAKSTLGVPTWAVPVVDVRDVAAAHLAAAYLADAAGRYILCGQNTNFAQVGLALQEKYGTQGYPVPHRAWSIPRAVGWLVAPLLGLDRRTVYRNLNIQTNLDSTKAREQLGMEFRPLKRTVEDMYQQMIDDGLVQPKASKRAKTIK